MGDPRPKSAGKVREIHMFGMKKRAKTPTPAAVTASREYRAAVATGHLPTPAMGAVAGHLAEAARNVDALRAALTPALDQTRLAAMTPAEYTAAVNKAGAALAATEDAIRRAVFAARV